MSTLGQLVRRARELAAAKNAGVEIAIARALDEIAESSEAAIPEGEWQVLAKQELAGFGVLQPFLDNPEIEEIWINRPNQLHYYSDRHHVVELDLTAAQIRNLTLRMLASSGRRVDRLTPYVDANLPDGSRLHVVIPELTKQSWAINIRKFRAGRITLRQLEHWGSLSQNQRALLEQAMLNQKSILIAGATQAGKTTLMTALLAELRDDERLISCEDTFELAIQHDDWVAMQVRPASAEGAREIGLRELVRQSLRMRPSRLVIGEVRGAEALDMLVALNSGIPGLCTLHADSAKTALQKLLTLPLLAGENITDKFLRPTIQGAFDLVVFCKRLPSGQRIVTEILEVTGEVL
jgi:pilus assembly protein CpaF